MSTRNSATNPICTFPPQRLKKVHVNIRRKSARAFISLPLALLLSTLGTGVAHAESMKGKAGQMPAFYEGKPVTVNMKEMPAGASAALIAHNGSINTIYAGADLDDEQPFPPVIDAIQREGFNPLWRQVRIVPPTAFTSEADILAAAAAGTITLVTTDEVYRCSVVAPSPRPR
ncbi:hypothetical protein [Micromonospora sp. RTP1Z1]|uniref:hypothetical protein n=1 Tax=Micromonospora sp. RTP1Z1 TaxID=2994043 RepID=UPI0029C65C1B|nr:hypothetical protein [Micromonospora sp. RTP1Z1]